MKAPKFLFSSKFSPTLALCVVCGFGSNSARAATQYFSDAGGPLAWDAATNANWGAASGGPYDSLWTSGNAAVFEGTGGTVNVGAVNAVGMTFNVAGYTLSGGTITLTSGAITTHSTTTIGSVLAGTGTLTLTSDQYTGRAATVNSPVARNDGPYMIGQVFTLANPTTVSALGVYAGGLTSGTLPVAAKAGVWNSGGIELTSVTVPAGTPVSSDGYAYASVTPVTLPAGSGYTMGAQAGIGFNGFFDNGTANMIVPVSGLGITFTNSVFNGVSSSFVRPTTSGTTVGRWSAANMQVSVSGVSSTLATQPLSLTGVNTYTGATTINGPLSIDGAGQLGSGTYAGAIANTNSLIYNSSASQTLSGVISGAGSLTKGGTSTLTLSGSNTYTGGLNVNQGTLTYTGSGSALNTGGGAGTGGNVKIASGATLNLSGSNNNELEAYGTWTIAGTLSATTNKAHSIRAAAIILNGGTMTSSGGSVATYGAFYEYQNTTITANGTGNLISGNGDFGIQSGTALTLATPLSGDSLTVSTILKDTSGAGALTKTGAGTTTLSGVNTYTGATTVSGGTLKLTGGSLGNTAITVGSGTTLAIQPGAATTINLGSTATSAAGATLNLGAKTFDMTDGAVSTCNLQQGATFASNALTVTNGATLKFDLGNTGADKLAVTKAASVAGTVNVTIDTTGATSAIAPGTYNLVTAASGLNGGTWQFTGGGTTKNITVGGAQCVLTLVPSGTAVTLNVAVYRTLVYNGNTNDGGTAPIDGSSPYTLGSTVTVLPPGALTKTGYAFSNWNTQANGSGTSYGPAATFSLNTDTILYAQWALATSTVTADPVFPSAISTTYGTASGSTSVSVSGSSLTGDITAAAPAGLEVSSNGTTFGSTATFTQSGGTASGTLYVRIKSNASVLGGPYDNANVVLISTGAPVVNVATTAFSNTVSPKSLTVVSATAANKLFDGTTDATITGTLDSAEAFGSGSSGDGRPYTGDVLTVSASGYFDSPAVGNGVTVTADTFVLDGASAWNYSLIQPNSFSLSANIVSSAVWTQATGGSWITAGNWQASLIGTGAGVTADFSTLSLPANAVVTLDGARTIGNLLFDDQNTTKHSWTLNPNLAGSLTLAVPSGSPVISNNVPVTLTTVLAGTQGLTKTGSGTLTLSGANTLTGGVAINSGTLAVGSSSSLASSNAITLGVNSATNPTLSITSTGGMSFGALTVPSGVTGATISLLQNSSTVSYAINGATLGSVLNVNQSNTVSPNWSQIAWSSKITGTGGGAGNDTLVFSNTSGSQNYFTTNAGVVNDFSGNIHLKAGGVFVQSGTPGGNLIIPDASMLWIEAGEWRWNNGGMVETLDGLRGAGTMGNPGNVTLTINSTNSSNDGNRTFSGSLGTMGGTLTKTGSGTQTFSGTGITYTNATVVNGGTLALSGTTAFASSGVTVNTGGTLLVNNVTGTGTGTTALITVNSGGTLAGAGSVGTATINSGGFIAPGGSSTGNLATGNLTIAGTYNCQLDGANSDKIAAGTLTLTGATLAVSTISPPTAGSYLIATYTGTAPSFTTVTGVPTGYVLDMTTTGQIKLSTSYLAWASGKGLTSGNNGQAQDADGDGFSNLMEFAFGTDPLNSASGAVSWTGNVVNAHGQPTTNVTNIENGVDFRAVFGRRKDYVAAGLTYTVQFSAGLDVWEDSVVVPTVLASDSETDVVSVPYPMFIQTGNGMEKPTFFRVRVVAP